MAWRGLSSPAPDAVAPGSPPAATPSGGSCFFTKRLVAAEEIGRYQFTIRVAPGHRGENAVVSVRKWVTKKLRPGDMTALSHILQKRLDDPQPGSLDRLALRGFIKTKANSPVVTLLGRVALLLRQLTQH